MRILRGRIAKKETSTQVFQVPPHNLPLSFTPPAEQDRTKRRRWTAGELMELVAALATLKTQDIAHAMGVNPKALRSVLRRNGVSLRALREHARKERLSDAAGLVVRRPVAGPSATFGAAALAELPDEACRWPSGDPAEPAFSFCSAPRARRSSYCAHHAACAYEREDDDERG
jgi:hypothetical protein